MALSVLLKLTSKATNKSFMSRFFLFRVN